MAKKCWTIKAKLPPKFRSRVVRRCALCGRSRSVYRKFGVCRICLRTKALRGEVPGMRKASW
jgi:small subunit ribosomal protein S14